MWGGMKLVILAGGKAATILASAMPGLAGNFVSQRTILALGIAAGALLLLASVYAGIQAARRSHPGSSGWAQLEDRYRGLIEETSDIIHIVSPEGKFLYVNRAWRQTFGYRDEEIAKLTLMDLLHPEELEKARRQISQLMTEQRVMEIETRFVSKDGRTIWVEGNSTCEMANGAVVSRRGIFHNVTERKQSEAERARLLAILEDAPDFIATFTPEGKVLWMNRAWRRLINLEDKSGPSQLRISDLHPWRANQILEQALPTVIGSGSWEGESALLAPEGQEVPISQTIVAHKDESGTIVYLSTLCRDITERRRAEHALREAHSQLNRVLQREKELARTDVLTGLSNRRAFYEALQMERARTARYGRPITLAYVDLDNFKRVNDSLGHAVGDELLVCVADLLRQTLRLSDTVGRLGGDEFALLLPETSPGAAESLLQKLRKILMDAMQGRNWPVSFSIGAATFLNNPPPLDQMIRAADELMYAVKKSGKNSVEVVAIGGGPQESARGTSPA
jgi:diguanylate cyclase (GGDEF)-like protein/PAS domain S-box-containing protein